MPINLSTLRTEIRDARQLARDARREMLRLEKEIDRLEREAQLHFRKDDQQAGQAATATITQLRLDKQAAFQSHRDQLAVVKDKLEALNAAADPRELVEELSDDYPVFLMPLRMEARFMTIKHIVRLGSDVAAGQKSVDELFGSRQELPVIEDRQELWVRIFPDDIFVQNHEEELTEAENSAGQFFWTEMQSATQILPEQEVGESAAEYEERRLAAIEAAQLGAWTGLVSGQGKERSAWIALRTTPAEVDQLEETDGLTFPDLAQKAKSWSKAPQTDLLPDRVVIKLVSGTSKREVVGHPISHPLYLGISPQEEEDTLEAGEEEEEGLLRFPPQLKWLTDFSEAEKVGMGLRIPLSPQEAQSGFDRVLALGVCTAWSAEDGQRELSELIDNHVFTDGGFAILSQGTPTNNGDTNGSGFSTSDSDEDYRKIALQTPLYKTAEAEEVTPDGERLAQKLALDTSTAQRIQAADSTDLSAAVAMNQVLWSATFGYYLRHMLFPLISKDMTENIRDFFEQQVLGRGNLPALRVDDQPYGLLVCSAYDKWKASSLEKDDDSKQKLLDNILKNVAQTWDDLADQVKHAEMSGDTDELFLSIMSKHASSVEFYQRNAVGRLFLWNLHQLVSTIEGTAPPEGFEDIQEVNNIDFFEEFAWLDGQTTVPPNILDLVFTQEPQRLNGPLVDSLPPSEKLPLTEIAPGWNYLRWLRESSWQQIFSEDFSVTGAEVPSPPTSLLYLFVRHAVLLEYQEAGIAYLEAENQPLPTGGLQAEISNLQGLNTGSSLSDLRRHLEHVEMLRISDLVDLEVAEHLANFSGSAAEREEEERLFRAERTETLSAGLSATVDAQLEQADQDVESQSTEDIFRQSHGDLTDDKPLSEYVDQLLADNHPAVARLARLKTALGQLESMTTAQLERCFTEHIDLGTYRLDAWFSALASDRLDALRDKQADNPGNYLGAYGWLLDLRPGSMPGIHFEEIKVNPVTIKSLENEAVTFSAATTVGLATPAALETTGKQTIHFRQHRNRVQVRQPERMSDNAEKALPSFLYLGKGGSQQQVDAQYDLINDRFLNAPRVDPANQGFVHAPSLNQATAAAILRSAYEAHRSVGVDNAYAVNVNSKRVRKAVHLLEGIQNGQMLGALLGYQFERYLNDNTRADHNLNALIYDFRLAFPQVAGSITEADSASKVGEAEAYNVVDGLKILEAYQKDPADWSNGVAFPSTTIRQSVEAAVDELADAVDAIYDLMMAESVFQITQGNAARAGAALKMLNGQGTYTDPQIIRTPREYHPLTHRIGVQFDHQRPGEQVWKIGNKLAAASPRSITAPQLNRWIGSLLPSPAKIMITAVLEEDDSRKKFQLSDLGLQPIDFYFLMQSTTGGNMADPMRQRLRWHAKSEVLKSESSFKLAFDNDGDLKVGEYSLFSLLPIIEQLKTIIGRARPLSPDDLLLASELDERANDDAAPSVIQTEALKEQLHRLISDKATDADVSLLMLKSQLTDTLAEVEALDLDDLAGADLSAVEDLRGLLIKSNDFSVVPVYPATFEATDAPSIRRAIDQGVALAKRLDKQLNLATSFSQNLEDPEMATDPERTVELCTQLARAVLGKSFKVFPSFEQHDAAQFQTAFDYEGWLDHAGEASLEDWWREVARTNAPAKAWHLLDLFTNALHGERICATRIVQFPLAPISEDGQVTARWLGAEFPEDYAVPEENVSLVFHYPDDFRASRRQSGFVLEEWNEEIPLEQTTTGIALNYNAPNTEPPQVCLLAVAPELTGKWSWDDLMDTLESTIDWARKRGVDPDLLDQTPYAQVLPITLAALADGDGKTVLDLKRNIVQNPIAGDFSPILLQQYQLYDTLYKATNPSLLDFQDLLLNEDD